MYIQSAAQARDFARALRRKMRGMRGAEAGIAAPSPFIPLVAEILESSPVRVGAQGISALEEAHTGEVSAAMVKSAGADFCIIGHSERRALGESNEDVHAQLVAAAAAGLTPVLCVGERERSEDGAHVSFVADELREALRGAQSLAQKLVVAYEPVWAIGRGANSMSAPEVREMAIFIRKTLADILGRKEALRVPVLYGGSVEPSNAGMLIGDGDIAGLLVGHASAQVDEFMEIVLACRA